MAEQSEFKAGRTAGVTPGSDPLRILVAVPFSPRPDVMHGGRVIAQLLTRLAESHRVAAVYLRAPGTEGIDPELAAHLDFVAEVEQRRSRLPGEAFRRRLRVLSALPRALPMPAAVYFDRGFARAVARVARQWKPDVIQFEHDALAYCGAALEDVAVARVLVCHEPGLMASEDLAAATSGRQRLAHRLDARAWRRYWSRTLPSFNVIVTFTERDRRFIEASVRGVQVVQIPLGIDLPVEPLSPTGTGDPNVMFVGGFRHPPNADAAIRLIQSIAPLTRRHIPELRLTLVGNAPTARMFELATPHDEITGAVPSVTPYLDEASVVVLPIRLGGGMRVKLLEALAAGKAVVASPLAAAGLDVTNGEELAIAESDGEFVTAIIELLEDDKSRALMAQNARAWAQRHLRWDSRVRQYEQLYGRVSSASPGHPVDPERRIP